MNSLSLCFLKKVFKFHIHLFKLSMKYSILTEKYIYPKYIVP